MSKRKLKEYMISNGKNTTAQVAQLSIWRDGQGISGINIQTHWKENATNALWTDFMLYRLNLILNSNEGLALFRQKQILWCNRHKNLQKKKNEDFISFHFISFFIQFLNVWLCFTNNNFPTPTSSKKIIDQPQFLTHTPNWILD